jgi:PAS domain S-box-containing protein
VDALKKQFGERLRALRRGMGLTQHELAGRAGLSDRFLGRLERGLAAPSLRCLEKLARTLGVEPASLFAFEDPAPGRPEEAGIRMDPAELAAVVRCLPGLTVKRVDADMRLEWVMSGDPGSAVPSGAERAGEFCHEAFQKRGEPCPGCLLPAALAAGEVLEGEVRAPSGRVFLTRAIPLTTTGGRPDGAVHMALDVTAGKRLEEELSQAKRDLEHLLAASPAMLYVRETSPGYPATYVSESARALVGYSPEAFLGDWSGWLEHAFPGEKERIAPLLPELFGQGRLALEYRFRHANGSWRWLRDGMRLVSGVDGEGAKIVGCVTDVTDSKAAEMALRESEARFRNLFATNCTVQLLIDAETGVILDANPAAREFYGLTHAELKGMDISRIAVLPLASQGDFLKAALGGEIRRFRLGRRLAGEDTRDAECRISVMRLGERDVLHALVFDRGPEG